MKMDMYTAFTTLFEPSTDYLEPTLKGMLQAHIETVGEKGEQQVNAFYSLVDSYKNDLVKELEGTTFKDPQQVFDHLQLKYLTSKKEEFIGLYLDNKHRILSVETISVGTINQSLVHPRESFFPAIKSRACAVIFVHNHPSGIVEPSSQDVSMCNRLKEAGEILGINVLDFLIIGSDDYYSFVDHNLL